MVKKRMRSEGRERERPLRAAAGEGREGERREGARSINSLPRRRLLDIEGNDFQPDYDSYRKSQYRDLR